MVIVAATLLRIARLQRSKFWVLSAGERRVFVLETPEKHGAGVSCCLKQIEMLLAALEGYLL